MDTDLFRAFFGMKSAGGRGPYVARSVWTLLLVHDTHLALNLGILVVSLLVLDFVDPPALWDMLRTDEPVDDLQLFVLCCAFGAACGMGLASIRDGFRDAHEISVRLDRLRSV